MTQYIYAACPDSQEIYVYELTQDGNLNTTQIVQVPGQVQPMTLSPNKDFLYVGVRPDFRVLSYQIDHSNGHLSHIGTASLTGSPTHVSTDRAGKFFFSASYSFNCTSISLIGSDGAVSEPIFNIEGLEAPHSANTDINNKRLMIPALKEDHIRIFNLNDDGSVLEQNTKIKTKQGAGPRHMALHNNKKIAYCINELDSTLDVISLDTMEIIQTINTVPDNFEYTYWSADIHITPDNQYLYCSERSSSLITAFKVKDTGEIATTIGHFKTEAQPRGFAIDNTGNFLIATGQKSDFIAVHKINNDGSLSEAKRFPVGKGAMWVTVR